MNRRYVVIAVLLLMVIFLLIFSSEPMESDPDKKNNLVTYAKSMREGMIRGGLSGLILGNYEGLVDNIVSYGIVSPIMRFIEG